MSRSENKKSPFETRIHEIDFFRGILIILVIFDHLMWFISSYIFHWQNQFLSWYWTSDIRYAVRQVVLLAFLFTCGVSCYFSRNNVKRASILLLVCAFITTATHFIQGMDMFSNRAIRIDCNILLVICLSIFLYCLCARFDNKFLLMIAAIMMIFYVFILISERNDTDMTYYPFKSVLYVPFNPVKYFYVGDYLPLFPYCIALFFGVIFARKFYTNKTSLVKKREWERPICFLGRHTLIIYLAHEVILTLIFMGIGALIS